MHPAAIDFAEPNKDTGEKRELILQDKPGVLGEADLREDQTNLATIARIERLYEERLDQRGLLQVWLARLMAVVESQDRERTELSQALDQFEVHGID